MRKISLAAAAALCVSASMSAAGEVSVEGVLYGDYTKYSEEYAPGKDGSGYLNGSVDIGYKSGALGKGFSYNLGARVNRKITAVHDGEWLGVSGIPGYDPDNEPFDDTVFHTANVVWSNDLLTIVGGRQYIELEWLGDYHEALVGLIKPNDMITIALGHTKSYATADYDAYNGGFEKFNPIKPNSGASVIDVAIEPTKGLTIEPWFYLVPDVQNWLGGKIAFERERFGVSAAYTIGQSNSKFSDEDSSFLHAALNFSPSDAVNISMGFAQTQSKEIDAGLWGAVGENVNPFEDGDYFFANDTTTIYVGVTHKYNNLDISAIYGTFSTGDKVAAAEGKTSELDLVAEYAINDSFAVRGVLVDQLGGKDAYENEDRISLRVAGIYSFGAK